MKETGTSHLPKQPGASEQILQYLDRHGTVDKDRSTGAGGKKRHADRARAAARRRPGRVVDLHGLTSLTAASAVRRAVGEGRRGGIDRLVIVHGQGRHSAPEEGPVLKKLVRGMLENELCDRVRGYRGAGAAEGGEGATIVYLR
jgi:DNA-nicking Smr family endonuclease